MAFLDAFKRRRPYQTPGFAGGYLLDDDPMEGSDYDKIWQLGAPSQEPQQPTQRPPILTAQNQEAITRPRRALPDEDVQPATPQPSPFQSRFAQSRPRVADPVTFGSEKLRDFENEPMGWRDKAGLVAQNIAQNLGYKPLPTRRQQRLGKVEGQLGRDVAVQDAQAKREAMIQQRELRKKQFETMGLPDARYIERSDGVYEVSPTYPEGRKVGNVPAEARSKNANPTRYFEREDGVYGINDEHPEGFKVSGVPGKPASDAQAAQAAEGNAIASSTSQAADAIKKETDDYRNRLTENERAIKTKEAYWRSEANRRFQERMASEDVQLGITPKPTMKDVLEEVKAEDPSYQSGEWDQLQSNTEGLRTAVKDNDKRLKDMEDEIRKGQAKGARSKTSRGTGRTIEGAISAFRAKYKRNPTEEETARMKAALGQ